MTLFKNRTAQEIWIGHWCDRCYRSIDGVTDCNIIRRALASQRRPPQWERNTRAQLMQDAYKCTEYATKPPRKPKRQLFEDVSMFGPTDLTVTARTWLPAPGWPDDPKGKGEGDHA